MVLLSEALNFDFGSKDMDSEFTDDELRKLSWDGFRERVISMSGKPNPTVRDFVHFSGRGTIGEFPIFCGTPAAVADQMEEWFNARACDGFVLAATHSRVRSRISPATSCRIAAARAVSQGLCGGDAARKPWPAAPQCG